jgi:galactose mutarotase-like enzyme
MPQESQPKMSSAAVSEMTWHGQAALKLENATLQVVVVPEMGAKIVSLFDKRNQVEWLPSPGGRPFEPVPYGAVFTDQDMSGWDEMFPTIVTCQYTDPHSGQRISLPDHGEVWAVPWQPVVTEKTALSFSVEGRALPYKLSRTIEFQEESIFRFTYQVINQSEVPLSALWAAHPQFSIGVKARVILPPHITKVCNVLPEEFGWGQIEKNINWPETTREDGKTLRLNTVGPPERNRARKFYVPPDTQAAWIAIYREPSGDWISLSWDTDEIPYLGIWMDEGYISSETVIAPEPSTGFYDSLALAIEKGRQMVIEPGQSFSWSLLVRFGDHDTAFL